MYNNGAFRDRGFMETGIRINPRVQACDLGIKAFQSYSSSIVSDACGRLVGATGLLPIHQSELKVCGNALTVKVRGGDNHMIYVALEMLKPGDVLVIDGEGDLSRALVGEIIMLLAQHKGAVGFVVDGAVRDSRSFEAHRFPCWARGINLRGPYKEGPGSVNVAVSVGGMLVQPGDILLADSDGVIAISPNDWQAVIRAADDRKKIEANLIESIKAHRFDSAWVHEAVKRKGGAIPKP